MRDDTEILRTIHGSHLYGLAGIGSDLDIFRVVFRRRRTLQRIDGPFDITEVGLDRFLENVFTGAHQSCEAMFSPYKVVHPMFAPMFEDYRVTGSEAFNKYRRTITAFAHHADFKRRRHAVRLQFALWDLEKSGRFNPVLTERQAGLASGYAMNYYGEKLIELVGQHREDYS